MVDFRVTDATMTLCAKLPFSGFPRPEAYRKGMADSALVGILVLRICRIHGLKSNDKCLEEVLTDIPYDPIIDTHVVVHDTVSETPDPVPVDSGMVFLECFRPSVSGFTDDLEVPDDGIQGLVVGDEPLETHAFRICQDLLATRQDVIHQQAG